MEPDRKRVKLQTSAFPTRMESDSMKQLRAELEAYLKIADSLPDAPDVAAFLEDPTKYNPKSPCLTNSMDTENNTPLITAVKNAMEKAFFILLEGRDPNYINFQNSKGVTALNIASHRGLVDYVEALLVKGRADVNLPNTSGSTSLIQASHFGHTAVVEVLLTHGAIVDRANHKGTTALMRAAQEGHIEVVRALVKAGADVNKRNHERMNALMLASQRGHDAIVKLLIDHGADIDCQTVQGSTALMLACKRQHEGVVAVLLTAGAEMFIQDSRGRTARDTASKRNNKKILDMLVAREQVRLMEKQSRIERSHLLMKLYDLYSKERACTKTDINQYRLDNSVAVLHRTFELPSSLFRHIVKFIPWPRMWETVCPMLLRRCNIDPNEAIRGALSIMDEVLTDLNISKDSNQTNHLVRINRNPAMMQLLRSRFKMSADLLDSITRWQDVQSVLGRLDRGVNFSGVVADRVVRDADRLYKWYNGDDTDYPGSSNGGQAAALVDTDMDNDLDHPNGPVGGAMGGGGGGGAMAVLPPAPPAQVFHLAGGPMLGPAVLPMFGGGNNFVIQMDMGGSDSGSSDGDSE